MLVVFQVRVSVEADWGVVVGTASELQLLCFALF